MSIIYVDLDGVCSDFVSHALASHGREEVAIKHWNIEEHLGLTTKQFQKPINKGGASWWRSMPELPHWKKIWTLANNLFDEAYFLSSPAMYSHAEAGKKQWLSDRLGDNFDKHIFTNYKHNCAREDKVLVDDSEKNCEAFEEHGGTSILFPAAWNRLGEMKNPIPYLERQLEDVLEKIRAYEDWKQVSCYEEKDEDWQQFHEEQD